MAKINEGQQCHNKLLSPHIKPKVKRGTYGATEFSNLGYLDLYRSRKNTGVTNNIINGSFPAGKFIPKKTLKIPTAITQLRKHIKEHFIPKKLQPIPKPTTDCIKKVYPLQPIR